MSAVDAGHLSFREWLWNEILLPVLFVFIVVPVLCVLYAIGETERETK